MNNLYLGIFDFLEVLIAPLWIIVILVFLSILFVISKTIISEAKKKQKGLKSSKTQKEYHRDIEAYSDIPYVRVTFDGNKPTINQIVDELEIIEEPVVVPIAEDVIIKKNKTAKTRNFVKKN